MDMRDNRFTDLNTAQLILIVFSNNISGIKLHTINELNRIISTINPLNYKTVFVFRQLSRIIE